MKEETGSFCTYCYNNESRAKLDTSQLDLDAIKEKIKWAKKSDLCRSICLHGGESLAWGELTEELFSMIYRIYGFCSIQTNGLAITDEMIEMFKKYNISVGVSFDGYYPMNKFRCGKRDSDKIIKNLRRLKEAGVDTAVIATIHRANGTKEHRKHFKEFVRDLAQVGISGRFNPVTHPSEKIQLTPLEMKDFMLDMGHYVYDNGIVGWSPYRDMMHSLKNEDGVVCTFGNCNPLATKGGMTINHRGDLVRCHKFSEDYYSYVMDTPYNPRELILQQTDCRGCEYWTYCKGGCPADSVDFDWRNKSRWCLVWKALWRFLENRMKVMGIPIVERKDETPPPPKNSVAGHGDAPHGDSPHGDGHGDHYDSAHYDTK
jgi:uncharacterized protein